MTISHILTITYPTILMAVFANQICLPIPAVIFLMAAGALSAGGRMSLVGIVLTGVVGCLLADFIWFLAGRRWGNRLLRALCAFSPSQQRCTKKAGNVFSRWGLPSLAIAKFIPGLDGVMPPFAGMQGVGAVWFLVFDAVGSLLWSASYSFAGYFFADKLEIVAATLGRINNILAIPLAGIFCYFAFRAWRLLRMLGQLRLRKITPARLQEKLQTGEKVAVLDLLNFEGQDDAYAMAGIAGAARVAPSRLRGSAKVRMPPDAQIVLYCSSPNQLTSARVAVALRRKGISNVWVLDGGLKAWQELGLPVTTELASVPELAARFGVEIVE